MSYLREYAIAAYFRIFLPHISRLHGPHILKKISAFSDMPNQQICHIASTTINLTVTNIAGNNTGEQPHIHQPQPQQPTYLRSLHSGRWSQANNIYTCQDEKRQQRQTVLMSTRN